jgi:hypothetical protein
MICFQDKKASVCQSEAVIKSRVRGTDKGRFLVLALFSIADIEQTQADTPGIPLGDIKIVTAKGTKRHIERIHPETSFDEVKKKFIECCQYANVADPEVLWDTLSHNLDFDEVNRLPMIIQ